MIYYLLFTLLLVLLIFTLYKNFKPITFKGKTILITGASSGIGESLASEFHRLGAFVILCGRNKSELTRVHSTLPNSAFFEFDLSDSSKVFQRSSEILSAYQVDILVNNAGVTQKCLFEDTLSSLKVERKLMEVNFFSVVALTKSFVKSLKGRKGTIIVVSSIAGYLPGIGSNGYSAAKSGITSYYQSIAAELRDCGVDVVSIIPGFVESKVAENALNALGEKGDLPDIKKHLRTPTKTFVKKAVREIYNKKREITIIQTPMYVPYYLKSLFPSFSTWIVRKVTLNEMRSILKKVN